ncbi:prepilin-type N-terminal cleavage/methylation domain-containing protein [Elusimicrobium posterum]|uniref:type IV pilin protein n=1 Tax=Elusimicrobium posterum TaxID=3116653 RepID=UPI003C724396
MKKGFTLIELMVVVLIIAILASVALPQYNRSVEKSRASEAMLTVKSLGDSVKRYMLERDTYPDHNQFKRKIDVEIPNSQNFHFSISGSDTSNVKTVNAMRKSGSNYYTIEYIIDSKTRPQDNGKILCKAYTSNAKGIAVCNSLSKETFAYYYDSDYIASEI